jgi:hypothetical protein
MSFLSKAKRYFDLGAVAMSALELVFDVAKGHVGKDAQTALNGLEKIIKIGEVVRSGLEGNADPATLKAEIAKMRSDLQTGDAAVDDAIDEKFPPGEP